MPRLKPIALLPLLLITLASACTNHPSPQWVPKQPEDFLEWLFMTKEEKSQFKTMLTAQEKETFVEAFWERRNPNPGYTGNPLREEISLREEFCNQWFREGSRQRPGWDSDRGRIYMVLGAPDYRDRRDPMEWSGGRYPDNRAYERWVYDRFDLALYFVAYQSFGEYRLQMPPPQLHQALETVKQSLIVSQTLSGSESLEIRISCFSDHLELTLKTEQIFFKEEGGLLKAEIEVRRPDGPAPTIKQLHYPPHELLNLSDLTLNFSKQELGLESGDEIILEILDRYSQKKGRASCSKGEKRR